MADKKVVELVFKTDASEASKVLVDLEKGIKNTKDESGKLNNNLDKVKDSGSGFKNLKNAVGDLIPGFKGAADAGNGLLIKMYALVANPLGAVITAIVLAVTALYKAFTSTKAGGEQLEQMMAGLGAVMDVVRDRILNAGKAIYKFFTGDFKGAFKEAKNAVSGFGGEVAREFQEAANATKLLQQVDDELRSLNVSRAKLNRDLAKTKEIITDENASIAEKTKALKEVRIAETKQTEAELANAKKKFEAIKAKNALSDTSKKDLEAEAAAEAALYQLQQESASNIRSLNKQEKLLRRQANADAKEAQAERDRIKKEMDAARLEADKINREAEIALLDERNKELATREIKFNEDKAKLIAAGYKDFTKIQIAYEKDKQAITKKYDEDEKKKLDEDNKKRLESAQKISDDLQSQLDKEIANYDKKLKIQTDKNLEEANNEKNSFDARLQAITDRESQIKNIYFANEQERTAFEKANSDARKKIASDEAKAKVDQLNFYANALGSIANLIGDSTDAGKAAAIASTTISTYLAAQQAYASQLAIPTPDAPFRATLAAGIAVASGLANVQKIISTPTPNGGGGGGSVPSATTPQAPSFNVVGTSGANANQISKLTQSQEPIKAYVVAQDVTTQQALNRNIVTSASLG